MTASIHIRPVQIKDASSWERMRSELWPDEIEDHQSEIKRFFDSKRSNEEVFIAQNESGETTGFIELFIRNRADGCYSDNIVYIEGLFVESSVRRNGTAAALIRAAEQWGKEHGCSEIASDTEIENETSIAVHKAVGFQEMSRLVCFRKDLQ